MVATKRRFEPNLQRVRVLMGGKATRAYVCTRCLKAGKVQKALLASARLAPRGLLATARRGHRSNRTMEAGHAVSSRLGRITISSEAIAQIVAETALECYGVVGMKGSLRGQLARARRRPRGIEIGRDGGEVDRRRARRRRVRAQPRRGRIERQQPRRVRGRAADRAAGARRSRCTSTTCEPADSERRGRPRAGPRPRRRRRSPPSRRAAAASTTSTSIPSPTGTPGTNLTLTVRAVADAVRLGRAGRAAGARARGRTGGADGSARQLGRHPLPDGAGRRRRARRVDERDRPALTARALRGASDAAYRAVRRPVEGTMLSVDSRARGGGGAARGRARARPLGDLLVELVRHGEEAVARTPEQLDVLREAGVVDAGGAGLVELLRGVAGAVTGEVLPAAACRRGALRRGRDPPRALALPLLHRLRGRGRGARSRRARGSARGARRLARGRRRRDRAQGARPHGRPGLRALARHRRGCDRGSRDREHARAAGAPRATSRARPLDACEERGRRGRRGGREPAALRTLAEPVGTIRVVAGGQTANPSTAELVAALEELEADEAIILPNNSNVRLAAEHAAEQARLPAEVVPHRVDSGRARRARRL